MSKRLLRKTYLFDKFSKQLNLLKDNGLIDIDLKNNETYICPICLNQFEKSDLISDLSKNYLTEEDAPPDKLHGSRIALTCKECNSKAGYQIDNHLIKRIRDIDDSKFYKDSIQYREIEFEGTYLNSEITSEGNGIINLHHRINNNNPTTLDWYIYKLKNKSIGEILNLQPQKKPADGVKVNKALLKTNYIITFAKFGYIFLLDNYYNSIREEIKNPDLKSNGHFMINNQFESNQVGTYYVCNPNAKSIFNIFSLKTNYSETLIGALLPLPNMTPEQLHQNLVSRGTRCKNQTGVYLNTYSYDSNADLFSDLNEINRIMNWIKTAS